MKFSKLELGTEFYTERYGKEHLVMKINELEVWDEKDNLSFLVSPDLDVTIKTEEVLTDEEKKYYENPELYKTVEKEDLTSVVEDLKNDIEP